METVLPVTGQPVNQWELTFQSWDRPPREPIGAVLSVTGPPYPPGNQWELTFQSRDLHPWNQWELLPTTGPSLLEPFYSKRVPSD